MGIDSVLDGVLTADFWLGFVGALIVTAWATHGSMALLGYLLRREVPRRCGIPFAVVIGISIAWLWTAASGGKMVASAILRDGLINGAASSIAYENIVKPWAAERRKRGA